MNKKALLISAVIVIVLIALVSNTEIPLNLRLLASLLGIAVLSPTLLVGLSIGKVEVGDE